MSSSTAGDSTGAATGSGAASTADDSTGGVASTGATFEGTNIYAIIVIQKPFGGLPGNFASIWATEVATMVKPAGEDQALYEARIIVRLTAADSEFPNDRTRVGFDIIDSATGLRAEAIYAKLLSLLASGSLQGEYLGTAKSVARLCSDNSEREDCNVNPGTTGGTSGQKVIIEESSGIGAIVGGAVGGAVVVGLVVAVYFIRKNRPPKIHDSHQRDTAQQQTAPPV
jgi:hypothetical protein